MLGGLAWADITVTDKHFFELLSLFFMFVFHFAARQGHNPRPTPLNSGFWNSRPGK